MTYLELVQRLGREVGASGIITALASSTGEQARLKDWIGQAWVELQNEQPNWTWLRASTTFSTVTSQATYDPEVVIGAGLMANWVPNTFRVYDTSIANETFLAQLDYDVFRDAYILGTIRSTEGYPSVVTVRPDKTIQVALVPDSANYTIVADYLKYPTELSVDGDTPEMPTRFHMALVYKAMEWYASYEAAPEVAQRAAIYYRKMMDDIRMDQLPKITKSGSFLR